MLTLRSGPLLPPLSVQPTSRSQQHASQFRAGRRTAHLPGWAASRLELGCLSEMVIGQIWAIPEIPAYVPAHKVHVHGFGQQATWPKPLTQGTPSCCLDRDGCSFRAKRRWDSTGD